MKNHGPTPKIGDSGKLLPWGDKIVLLKPRPWSHLKGDESMAGMCWRSSEARGSWNHRGDAKDTIQSERGRNTLAYSLSLSSNLPPVPAIARPHPRGWKPVGKGVWEVQLERTSSVWHRAEQQKAGEWILGQTGSRLLSSTCITELRSTVPGAKRPWRRVPPGLIHRLLGARTSQRHSGRQLHL